MNHHIVGPDFSVQLIEDAFVNSETDLIAAADQDFSSTLVFDQILDAMDNQAIKSTGFHLQFGMQAKILVLNVFLNTRYTIAKDVVGPGSFGFPSAWLGLAYGF